MSPEIRIDGKLVADVPDQSGLHQALDGSPLWIDVSGIEASNRKQIIVLDGLVIGGKRIIGLTQEGKGNSNNSKKGGDRKSPTLEVTLHERPIRVTYSRWVRAGSNLADPRRCSYYEDRRTYYNPRWMRSHGRG